MKTINGGDYSSHNIPGALRINREVVPVVKLPEKMTYNPWNWVSCNSCVVKVQDLVSRDGTHTNKTYQEIVDVGGIHNYFGWDGNIILSSIAPDKTVFGLSKELYGEIIGDMKPNSYLTPDGETYLGSNEYYLSSREIERIIDDAEYLIRDSTHATPIGLVKGSNLDQVEYHTLSLQGYGIERYCFHAADYLYHGSSNTVNTAIRFQSAIRSRVPHLTTYGVGSNKTMRAFSQSDVFITQTHFTRAFYGESLVNGRWSKIPASEHISQELIMNNLSELAKIARDLNKGQQTLDYWLYNSDLHLTAEKDLDVASGISVQGGV